MLTVVVIIWLLVWWAVFGPLAFVRGSGRKLPVRKCPACGYSGRAVGIGRFKCGSCGHHFVLGVWGRPSSSLFAALAPFFTITAIVVTALILSCGGRTSVIILSTCRRCLRWCSLSRCSQAFRRRGFQMLKWTNKRAPGKGGIPSLFTIERAQPALPEHERYG